MHMTCAQIQELLDDHADLAELRTRELEALGDHGPCPCIGRYRCWVDHPSRERCRFGAG